MKYYIHHLLAIIVLSLGFLQLGLGQLSFADDDPLLYHALDRATTLYPNFPYHTSVKYGDRAKILTLGQGLLKSDKLSDIDRKNWERIVSMIPEREAISELGIQTDTIHKQKGIWNTFYKDPTTFWKVNVPDFFLAVDPVLHLTLGNKTDGQRVFENTRGLKIRGVIDEKFYFYSSIYETQRRYPNYIEDEIDRINAIPGQGFFKEYQSGIISSISGRDFLNGQAYFGAKISKSIDLQFGHGRHFIGDGIRSLLLSDYAHNYFYLKLSTQVWKFHLQNIFAEMAATSSADNIGNELLPKKYMAAHFLDFRIHPKLTVGLFESVIFSRENGFELQYLNPVILYRTVEQMLDSPDNVLIGLNIKWVPKDQVQLYGQLLIDELKTSQAFNNSGWWGNKVGYQVGLKYFNAFQVDQLDFQIEHNTARPYTYAHRTLAGGTIPTGSYTHFNQSLAHPYGANFRETIMQVKYHPLPKWWFEARFQTSFYGEAFSSNSNIGRDILKDYITRDQDFDNQTGQGNRQNVRLFHFIASYSIRPNYFIDLNYLTRRQTGQLDNVVQTNYWGMSFRANIGIENLDF